MHLCFSAGVAERHADEALGQVLERADAALLNAKRQGKATVNLSVPLVRAAEAPLVNECDQRTASVCAPIDADERESG